MKNNSNRENLARIVDPYVGIGYALELLGQSDYHRAKDLGEYFASQILPPLSNQQIKFYTTPQGYPCGMVSWARLSREIKEEVHETGRSLKLEEWNCGTHVFINDFIALTNDARPIISDMMCNVVPDVSSASSIRRHSDGSVKKINYWTKRIFGDRHPK
jgi:cytolysin-activating lysine-acyltransferase